MLLIKKRGLISLNLITTTKFLILLRTRITLVMTTTTHRWFMGKTLQMKMKQTIEQTITVKTERIMTRCNR